MRGRASDARDSAAAYLIRTADSIAWGPLRLRPLRNYAQRHAIVRDRRLSAHPHPRRLANTESSLVNGIRHKRPRFDVRNKAWPGILS